MTPEQKQSELLRHRAIILATLDYLLDRLGGSIVYDQFDVMTEYYQQQKIQTEKYYKLRRLDRLQQRLASLTKQTQNRDDVTFVGYIKEKTGYDVDFFEDLQKHVDTIVAKNEIRSQKELNDIGRMLHYYKQTSAGGEIVVKLKQLLLDYAKRNAESPSSANSRKRNAGYSEVISDIEKDGIKELTLRFSKGPKPKYFEEHETISPDGKRRIRITMWSDSKHSLTNVVIVFPTVSGPIYGIHGICHDVKASWKDNSTIVIETKTEYKPMVQNRMVRSFEDSIAIEYIEH